MDKSYELKTKICEKTGDEVISAVEKTESGNKEYCLCSHLCSSPCSMLPKNYRQDAF